jgi:hypothetical protein
VSSYVPSWLPDGMAELLDDVVSEVSEYFQGADHLVVIEGFCCSLAEEKDSLEHVHSVRAHSCLEESRFPLRVTCIFSVVVVIVIIHGQFVGVNAPLTLLLGDGLPGLQTEREASAFPAGSDGRYLWVTLLPLQGVKSGQRLNNVNHQSVGRAIGHHESIDVQLVVAG